MSPSPSLSTMGTVDAASRFGQLALTVCSLFSFIGRLLSSTVKFIFNMTLHKMFKYTLLVLASVLCLASVALLGLGIWLHKHPGVELVILSHSAKCLEYVCIGVAIAGIVLSLIGLFGGHREHRLLLALYCIMVPLLVFTPFLMGGPLAVVYKDNMEMLIRGETKMELKHLYGTPTHEDFTTDWDKAMKLFHCCGAASYSDFEGSMFQNLTDCFSHKLAYPRTARCLLKRDASKW
uniref:Tetraspanin n=2 Tax=Eptatretus burgeri TaxID=7764 RepID=A0A8C4WVZ3_EPTBU